MQFESNPLRGPRGRVATISVVALASLFGGCENPAIFPGGGGSPPGPGNRTLFSYQNVFAGSTHSCALVNGGSAVCWGTGGDLGDGTFASSDVPVRVEGAQRFAILDLNTYSCGITTNGDPWCWGVNSEGRLGNGNAQYEPFPVPVETDQRFDDITTGARHTCALDTTRKLWCWGSNRFGQLIDHPDTLSFLPVPIEPAREFREVDAGGLRTCAVETAGDAFCWGRGLPTGLVQVPGAIEFASLSVGSDHACGLTVDGQAFCFGSNSEGQLGDGTRTSTAIEGPPVPVDTELRFKAISAGEFHTCALTLDGEAWCWGRDSLGQLGDGDPPGGTDPPRKTSPTRVTPPNAQFTEFITISAGLDASCAATVEGVGMCWGFGTGSGSRSFSTTPVVIGS